MKRWLTLSTSIALEVAASLSLSAAQNEPLFFVVVVLGYIGAFAGLSLVLRWGMPLAVAYGIWGSAGVALTAVLGVLLFDDPHSVKMYAGVLLIVAGVILVELGRGQKSVPNPATRANP